MSKLIEKAKFLYVEADVRYWEDADVNGVVNYLPLKEEACKPTALTIGVLTVACLLG